MQLDQLQLMLRRRSPWEALDLGLVMLRHWRGPVYKVWLVSFVAFSALVIALLWPWPWLATLIIWWLKPLFDRILLKVFAEASFGAAPSLREVWRALPGLLKHSSLLAGLTYRRLSVHRSFDLPVWQLEGQRGKAARLRLRVLGRKSSSYAAWLTFVCVHVVVIFEFGLVGLLDILTPSDGMPASGWAELFSGEGNDAYMHVFSVAWVVAESIVEPFFVAAGFSLYLNRRAELEGWDIEVAFRHMAARKAEAAASVNSAAGPAALMVAGAIALSLLLSFPGTASADDALLAPLDAPAPTPSVVPGKRPEGMIRQAAERVLADPVFGHKVEESSWRPRKKDGEKRSAEVPEWMKQLAKWAETFATGVRGIIYVLLFLGVAFLLVLAYRYRHLVIGERLAAAPTPETLFGLDLRPASLPDDIAAAALVEVENGRLVAALSLLYRGALVELIRRQHIEFRAGDTEDACLRRVRGRIDAQAAGYFAQLLDAWKQAAYAEVPPAAERIRDLCGNWGRYFSAQASRATA